MPELARVELLLAAFRNDAPAARDRPGAAWRRWPFRSSSSSPVPVSSGCGRTGRAGKLRPTATGCEMPVLLSIAFKAAEGVVPLQAGVVVRVADGGRRLEVVVRRRRAAGPLQRRAAPGIGRGLAARGTASGPGSAAISSERRELARTRRSSTARGRLELRHVRGVAPRHAVGAHDELREERQVEADEHQQAAQPPPASRCTSAR